MPGMRVSLTARYVSHPAIDFGSRRSAARRPRLGLPHAATVFYRPRMTRTAAPTVAALRPLTARFSFPSVGLLGRVRDRRAALSLGTSRVRRA